MKIWSEIWMKNNNKNDNNIYKREDNNDENTWCYNDLNKCSDRSMASETWNYDKPSDRPTNQPTNKRINGLIGKFPSNNTGAKRIVASHAIARGVTEKRAVSQFF